MRNGAVLDGRYRIEQELAAGGFGAIYRATDLSMGREVALKVLHRELSSDPAVVERFRREAGALARLRDPHTITMYDVGLSADGTRYIVMELLRGESLYALFAREGRLPWQRVVAIARGVCSSMREAHAFQIVHRDLKPANIHLEHHALEPDYVKVLDFGIAKLLDSSDVMQPDLTLAGQLVGTYDYMSPEQMIGGACTSRADVFALAVIIYEMISGVRPYGADAKGPASMLMALLGTVPAPLSTLASIPPALERIVMAALAQDPRERPDIDELDDTLARILDANRDLALGTMDVPASASSPSLDVPSPSSPPFATAAARVSSLDLSSRSPTTSSLPFNATERGSSFDQASGSSSGPAASSPSAAAARGSSIDLAPLEDDEATWIDQAPPRDTTTSVSISSDQVRRSAAGPRHVEQMRRSAAGPMHVEQTHTPSSVPAHFEQTHTPSSVPMHVEQTRTPSSVPTHVEQTRMPPAVPAHVEQTRTPSSVPAHVEQTRTPSSVPAHVEQTHTPSSVPAHVEQTRTPSSVPAHFEQTRTPSSVPTHVEQTRTPSSVPAHFEQTHTPSSLPAHVEQARTPSSVPMHVEQARTPPAVPMHVDPMRTPSTTRLDPAAQHTPMTVPNLREQTTQRHTPTTVPTLIGTLPAMATRGVAITSAHGLPIAAAATVTPPKQVQRKTPLRGTPPPELQRRAATSKPHAGKPTASELDAGNADAYARTQAHDAQAVESPGELETRPSRDHVSTVAAQRRTPPRGTPQLARGKPPGDGMTTSPSREDLTRIETPRGLATGTKRPPSKALEPMAMRGTPSRAVESMAMPGTPSGAVESMAMPGAPSGAVESMAMPGAPSGALESMAMPGTPSRAVESMAMPGAPSGALESMAMPGAPSKTLESLAVGGTPSKAVESMATPGMPFPASDPSSEMRVSPHAPTASIEQAIAEEIEHAVNAMVVAPPKSEASLPRPGAPAQNGIWPSPEQVRLPTVRFAVGSGSELPSLEACAAKSQLAAPVQETAQPLQPVPPARPVQPSSKPVPRTRRSSSVHDVVWAGARRSSAVRYVVWALALFGIGFAAALGIGAL